MAFKMKVLHIVGNKIESSNGIGRLLPEMILMQNKYGSELKCALYCTNDNFKTQDFHVIAKNEMSNDVLEDFDLFIFHGLYFYEFIGLAKKILLKNKKYLVKPHSSLIIDAQKKSFLKKFIANNLFFKKFIRDASAVIFTNKDEAKNSVQWNSNVIFEGNGLASSQTVDNFKRCKVKPYKFVYLSRIDFSHKGTDILLNALLLLKNNWGIKDIDLSIYGKGSKEEELQLIKKVKELDFPSVTFCGAIYGQDKNNMFYKKDIFILTSRYEGFPMAILEALDAGLPCLVTRGVNMTSIIEAYNVGWECNTQPHAVANLIVSVLQTDESTIEEMSKSAKEYITKVHNWPSLVRYSESVYLNFATRSM
jgi:glycosyltransferase involved in cell wall biosynthesis